MLWKGSPTLRRRCDDLRQRRSAQAPTSSRTPTSSGPPTVEPTRSSSPASTSSALALEWGGTSHPVWFKRDPRVANVKVLGGLFNRAAMKAVPELVSAVLEAVAGLST